MLLDIYLSNITNNTNSIFTIYSLSNRLSMRYFMSNDYDYRECCLKCRYYTKKWCGLHEGPTGPYSKCDQYRPIKPTRLK